MSAFLYLGKMRINKVTGRKISHHYYCLVGILQAASELRVHFVISSHRGSNNLLHVQGTPTFTGLSLSPQHPPSDALCGSYTMSHDIPAPRVGTAVIFKHPQERWDQLERVQKRGGEQTEKTWTSLSLADLGSFGSQRATTGQGEQFLSMAGHLQAQGWSTSFVLQ